MKTFIHLLSINYPFIILLSLTIIPSIQASQTELLKSEILPNKKVWIDSAIKQNSKKLIKITVWFDTQLLGDGKAYRRRTQELSNYGRLELRKKAVTTLKFLSKNSHASAKNDLQKLINTNKILNFEPHWIINGFSCTTTSQNLQSIAEIPGVKKIFHAGRPHPIPVSKQIKTNQYSAPKNNKQIITTKNLPWYIPLLHIDSVWKEHKITGKGILNVIHDYNFVFCSSTLPNAFKNPQEIPNNGKDDDNNGLIDDYHGYNFDEGNHQLNVKELKGNNEDKKALHGTSCAHIICGTSTNDGAPQLGVAPQSQWAGIITKRRIEAAIQWAIEQKADTYSMSFSKSNLGELRSHWRKIMEHGSFCGIYFISGAGNNGLTKKTPTQLNTPEDIPEALFSVAGVNQKQSFSPTSGQGPVHWDTEHYKDGFVPKPEVCAFKRKTK